MLLSQFCRRFVVLALAGLLSATPAIAGTPDSPIQVSANVRASLEHSSVPIRSWMTSGIGSSHAQLIYASLITSGSTGETNVYEVSGNTLKLVGQLVDGGGPVAVDRNQNVYVADAGANLFTSWPARSVYEFARGATKPKLVLHPNGLVWNIAVGYDGTVYLASAATKAPHLGSILRYRPGSTIGTLLPMSLALQAGLATGMVVDSAGDLFAGWQDEDGPPPCSNSCVLGLSAGATSWKTLLTGNGAANGLEAGPFLDEKGDVVVDTVQPSGDQHLMLGFVPGSLTPERVIVLPIVRVSQFGAAFAADGTSFWFANTLLSGPPFSILLLDYPSGNVKMSFPIPETTPVVPSDEGIAVSPAFYP
jgi:hypothetical protein